MEQVIKMAVEEISGRYRFWLGVARSHVRVGSDGEDLLQDAMLIALRRSIFPLQSTDHDPWFAGVLKKQAAFQARSAGRARRHEQLGVEPSDVADDCRLADKTDGIDSAWLMGIAPAQRSVLMLALHGLNRAEIRQVLDIGDDVLRQRVSALKRTVSLAGLGGLSEPFQRWLASRGSADAGLRRAALARGSARIPGFRMGMSDPDGHLLGIHVPPKTGN